MGNGPKWGSHDGPKMGKRNTWFSPSSRHARWSSSRALILMQRQEHGEAGAGAAWLVTAVETQAAV